MADVQFEIAINSGGGPLVALPASRVADWRGILNDDYSAACQIQDLMGVIARPWGQILVLGGEPFETRVVERPDGVRLVCCVEAPDVATVWDVVNGFSPFSETPFARCAVKIEDEPYILFDSADPGDTPNPSVRLSLPPGNRAVLTYHVRPNPDIWLVIHRFV